MTKRKAQKILGPGTKVRMLRSFHTLKKGAVYTVQSHVYDHDTVMVAGCVYLFGEWATENGQEGATWELA